MSLKFGRKGFIS